MTAAPPATAAVNGWSIFLHPLFVAQLEELRTTVDELRRRHPREYISKNATKRLAAINKLAFELIPQNPGAPEYRLGNTLGANYTHWFRAKFFQQYRLFFRFDTRTRVIVYAWVNDERTKRAYGSKTDAYYTFKRMLDGSNPPDDFKTLLEAARAADCGHRLPD
jgi:toxin YhaV